jgi:hypothetical protein
MKRLIIRWRVRLLMTIQGTHVRKWIEMYFTSCTCADPFEQLMKLQDPSSLPGVYQQYMVSMDLLRYFVVVHDNQTMDRAK